MGFVNMHFIKPRPCNHPPRQPATFGW